MTDIMTWLLVILAGLRLFDVRSPQRAVEAGLFFIAAGVFANA